VPQLREPLPERSPAPRRTMPRSPLRYLLGDAAARPLPSRVERSTPCSFAMRRTNGEEWMRSVEAAGATGTAGAPVQPRKRSLGRC